MVSITTDRCLIPTTPAIILNMKRYNIVKNIIENSRNLNLKEFGLFAKDPLKRSEKLFLLNKAFNYDLDKLLDIAGKDNLSAYIMIFDHNNKISFIYYLHNFCLSAWKVFMYKDYWRKYQQKNNLNCFFKIIDSRKFKSYGWNEKIIFKYMKKYLRKNAFMLVNYENCKKTFYFYNNDWLVSQIPIFANFIEKNNIKDEDLFNKLYINPINPNETKRIIHEFHEFIISYVTILWDIIYSKLHYK